MSYYRKVITIRAEDSPNVRLAMAQKRRGEEITGEVVVPGVLSWEEYRKRRRMWDEFRQTVSLDAQFYKGAQTFLFPSDVITRSRQAATRLRGVKRRALAMGIDAAEGGDSTVWTVVDWQGIVFQRSQKTADTADIPGITIGLIREYGLEPDMVVFDRGGGGKEHADVIRRKGFDVRTVGFSEQPVDPHKDRKTSTIRSPVKDRVTQTESKYAYKNRRAEMYGIAASLFARDDGFAVPGEYAETLRQLEKMPKDYDGEGRMYLPPKDKPHPSYTGITIRKILGRSPDEADSLVIACFGMTRRPTQVTAGAL